MATFHRNIVLQLRILKEGEGRREGKEEGRGKEGGKGKLWHVLPDFLQGLHTFPIYLPDVVFFVSFTRQLNFNYNGYLPSKYSATIENILKEREEGKGGEGRKEGRGGRREGGRKGQTSYPP